MDESISFGTLGDTGKGVTEYFNVPVSNEEQELSNLNLIQLKRLLDLSGGWGWTLSGFVNLSRFLLTHSDFFKNLVLTPPRVSTQIESWL